MTFLDATILGIVEGATEFIPVSSSGHLIIVRDLLGLGAASGLAFDAIVQAATILAVAAYFWRDLWALFMTAVKWIGGIAGLSHIQVSVREGTLLKAIIVGTIPAVIFGLLLEEQIETLFRDIRLVALMLVLGNLLMLFAEWVARRGAVAAREGEGGLMPGKGLGIGLFQCLALVPGMSRSGATISGGLILGLDRAEAARFSFLLSFPVIVGAGAKKLLDVGFHSTVIGAEVWLASIVAFAVGLASIHFLITYLRTHTLYAFVWYRFALAAVLLATFVF